MPVDSVRVYPEPANPVAFGSYGNTVINHGAAVQFDDDAVPVNLHPLAKRQVVRIYDGLERQAFIWRKMELAIVVADKCNMFTDHGFPTAQQEASCSAQITR